MTGEIVIGVRIRSAPDRAGVFTFERTSRQIGEAASPAFLAPSRREDAAGGSADPNPRAGYHDFLDGLIAAARQIGFRAAHTPGRDDPCIRGLRQ